MTKNVGELLLYLSGVSALGLSVLGLFLAVGHALLQLCCGATLVPEETVLDVLAGEIWYPVIWAVVGAGLLAAGVKTRD